MFHFLSKIFWLFAEPLALSALVMGLGLALFALRRRRVGGTLVVGAWAMLCLTLFTTLGQVLIGPLEARFARPAQPAGIAGIIVLGGGMDGVVSAARGGYELGEAGDRMVEAARLALLYPDARVLVSGGVGSLEGTGEGDAAAAPRLLAGLGIGPERLVLEGGSRNTLENARFSRELIGEGDEGEWLLVTSAFHMPRSMGLFRAVGLDPVPWPVDYRTTGSQGFALAPFDPPGNARMLSVAVREWIGLLAYWAAGMIAEPFPGPDQPSR